MYFEVPKVTRCCFCLPLRYGLIGCGYLKLILMIGIIFWSEYGLLLLFITQSVLGAFILAALIVDFILTVAFVIGGHIKNVLILKIFMWHTLFMTAAQVALTAYVVIEIHNNNFSEKFEEYYIMTISTTSVCLQLFLIFSIRSEVVMRQDKARESAAVQYQMGGETIRV